MAGTRTIAQIAAPASTGLGIALPLLTSLSNPVSAAIAAGVGLIALVDKIGQGRKAANKFTSKGGPQDIINRQLAAISSSKGSTQEKAQATEKAWTDFIGASNEFASANPKQAKVVQQAIYQTPELTNTVRDLLGRDPLDAAYTSATAGAVAQGRSRPNPGPSVTGELVRAGVNVGTAYASSRLSRGGRAGSPGSPMGGVDELGNPTAPPNAADVSNPGARSGGSRTSTNNPSGQPSLLSRLAHTLISGATSLVSGAVGARAAGRAANVQANASTEAARIAAQAGTDATNAQRENLDKTLAFNRETLDRQQRNIQPWVDAGTGALRKIGDITSDPNYSFGETFKAPTAEEAMQDPGIQYQLQQGQRAIEAYQRATGTHLSGGAVKDINANAQGIAATGYQNVFNRNLAAFNTRYGTFANERSAR